jgi:hypothetical protein
MTIAQNPADGGVRMRRISITVEIEIPEYEFADLAEEALQTGKDLRRLIAARYGATRRSRAPGARLSAPGPAAAAKPVVSDFAHLFNSAPAGQRAYRGSGRPPKWLLALIEKEIAAGNAA